MFAVIYSEEYLGDEGGYTTKWIEIGKESGWEDGDYRDESF